MIKPILFNTDMVRAILDDRKGATRRVVKGFIPDDAIWGYTAFTPKGYISCRGIFADGYGEKFFKLPCEPGDILYVRETWQHIDFAGENNGYVYKASENGKLWETESENWTWKPSIHMPKEAARIFLKVTNVRVERLQEIDDEGVISEGLEIGAPFDELWDFTIKKSDLDRYGWEANPWVWVIEFERCEKPEEEWEDGKCNRYMNEVEIC